MNRLSLPHPLFQRLRQVIVPFLVASLPVSAIAQEPVPPEEFELLAQGYTLYFTENGNHYGSEQFLQNRRTVWRASDGRCVNGKWAVDEGAMCFIYDDNTGVHCWTTYREGDQLFVLSTKDPPDRDPTLLQLSRTDRVPISCTGPRTGV